MLFYLARSTIPPHVGGSDAGLSGASPVPRGPASTLGLCRGSALRAQRSLPGATPAAELLHQLHVRCRALLAPALALGYAADRLASRRRDAPVRKFAAALLDELGRRVAPAGDALHRAAAPRHVRRDARARGRVLEEVVRAVTLPLAFVERDATAIAPPPPAPRSSTMPSARRRWKRRRWRGGGGDGGRVCGGGGGVRGGGAGSGASSTRRGAGSGSTAAPPRLPASRDADRGGARGGLAGGRHAHVRVDQAAARRDGCRFEDVPPGRDRLRPRGGESSPASLVNTERLVYPLQVLRLLALDSNTTAHSTVTRRRHTPAHTVLRTPRWHITIYGWHGGRIWRP